MQQIKLQNKILLAITAVMLMAVPFGVLAVNHVSIVGPVNFQMNIIDAPFDSTIIVGQTGGLATQIVVDTSNMIVTLDDGTSSVRFDKTVATAYFKVTKVSGPDDYTVLPVCPDNYVTLTGGSSGSVELKIEMTTTRPGCLAPPPTGGQVDLYPLNYSVNINNNATCTVSSSVTLNLASDNTSDVIISNDPNFAGASWQPFTSSTLAWTLDPGDGTKTVYVQYKTANGRISPVLSDSIVVNSAGCQALPPPPPPPPPPVTPPSGCIFDCNKVSYDLYIVNPDGTERHMGSNYVRAINTANNIYTYYFEDKGGDFDYNDVVIKVDKSTCSLLKITVVDQNSAWNHQVRMKLFDGGTFKEDLLLWSNDRLGLNQVITLDLNSYASLCEFTTSLNYGDLLKGSEDTVYYYASDGKRYVFPNRETYMSWYPDFSGVKFVTNAILATIPIGRNVTYRPGVRMIKLNTLPRVYAVDLHGTLRWVTSEAAAVSIYGANWQSYIDNLSDVFYINYKEGANINSLADFNPPAVTASAWDIEQELGLK